MQKGDKVGPYQVISEIGRGGMGAVVYLVEDDKKEKWALKVLLSVTTKRDIDLIKRAAKIYRKLHHRSIVHVKDYEFLSPYHCLVMEYAEGRSLQHILDADKKLPIADIVQISWEICNALVYAHSKNVIHRDLKPENVIVEKNNCVKVTDFDLASVSSQTITSISGMVGTPKYISPEQAAGEEGDKRSDLYSFGVVIYQMLTGRVPFEAKNSSVLLNMHQQAKPKSISEFRTGVPKRLTWLVEKAMAKLPNDRFQSAIELKQALEDVATEENISLENRKPPESFWKQIANWSQEHWSSIAENILANIIWVGFASVFVLVFSWLGIRNWDDIEQVITAWLNPTPTPIVLVDMPTPTPTNTPFLATNTPLPTKPIIPPTNTSAVIQTPTNTSRPRTVTRTPTRTSPPPTATPFNYDVPVGKALIVVQNDRGDDLIVDIPPYTLEVPRKPLNQQYGEASMTIEPGQYYWSAHKTGGGYYIIDIHGNKAFEFMVTEGEVYIINP